MGKHSRKNSVLYLPSGNIIIITEMCVCCLTIHCTIPASWCEEVIAVVFWTIQYSTWEGHDQLSGQDTVVDRFELQLQKWSQQYDHKTSVTITSPLVNFTFATGITQTICILEYIRWSEVRWGEFTNQYYHNTITTTTSGAADTVCDSWPKTWW